MKKSTQSALQLWLSLAAIPVATVIAVFLFGTLFFDDNAIIEIDPSLSKEELSRIPDSESKDLDNEFTAPLDQPTQTRSSNQQQSILPDISSTKKELSLTQMLSKKNENLRLGTNGHPILVRVQENDDLLTLAEKHLGSSSFWPYIFIVNKEKLSTPNALKAGMTLYLPDSIYYNMNINDTLAIGKAEELAKTL